MSKKKEKANISILERKLPLERFIPSVFILFLLFLVVLSVITYQYINQYKENVKWVNNIQDVINNTRRIGYSFLEIPLSRQNYILTGDNKYLTSYYNSQNKVRGQIKELTELVNKNDSLKKSALELDSLTNDILFVFNSSIDEYESKKFLSEDRMVTINSAETSLEKIMSVLDDIKNYENELLAKRNSEVVSSSYFIQVFIVLTSLFAFAVIGLSLYISNRLIMSKSSAEKLLQKSYDELEDRVEERTAELESVNVSLLNEISSRMKIENSLRESESRFRIMADSTPVMIWMSGKDKLCTYFNKCWLDFTGRKLEEELGNGWSEGVHPEDLQRCFDTYILAFDKREDFEMEYRLKNSKGEYVWILDKGIPRYEGSEFSGYIGGCIDIQSRKINEHYLNIQNSVSRILSETSSIEESTYKVLQSICEELNWQFGILWAVNSSKDKLKPQSIWSSNPSHYKEFSRIYDQELEKGEDLPGLAWKSGKSIWLTDLMKDHNFRRKDIAYRLGLNSAVAAAVSNGSEITSIIECFNSEKISAKTDLLEVLHAVGRQIGSYIEKKKTEKILRESYNELENRVKERTLELADTLNKLLKEIEQKEKIQSKLKLFAHAIKGIKECVYITDLQNKTIFVNSAFESTYGFFEQELIDKEIPVLFSDNVSAALRNEVSTRTLRNGWRGELKNRRKDGSEFSVHLSTSVIRNDEGKIEAIVGICQDVTDMKASEELTIKRNSLLKLLNDIIIVTNKSFNLNNSITYAVNKVCQYTSWDAGHCYLKNESGKLVTSGIWNYNIDEKYRPLIDVTESTELGDDDGMSGKVMQTAKSLWLNMNECAENAPERVKLADKLGLKSVVLIPIIKQTAALGVLEFFIKSEDGPDNEILECVNNIGVELGSLAERIEILDKVKISERQFKAVADTANDAIVTSDRYGRIIYINKSTEKIFGYLSDELVGKDIEILMPEKYKELFREAFSKAIETGRLTLHGDNIEFTAISKSGNEFPIELSLAKWEINNELYFTAMIKDISARKEIETELIEKQKMLLEAQQIAKLGSWEWDIDRDQVKWSDGMYDVYELKKSRFNPNFEGFLDRVHPGDRERVKEIVLNALKDKQPFNYYHRVITPANKVKIIKAQGEIILDENGKAVKMFGTGLDITDIKEAEEKVTQSERLLKEAQQIAKLGSWELNLVNGEQTWSDELYRICDFKSGQGIPSIEQIMELIHPDDVNLVKDLIKSLKNNPSSFEISFRIIIGSGILKYITAEILTESDSNGQVIRYYGSIQDVTDIKLVEEELRKANEKLIEAQNEAIHNEKLAALGRFSSGIAHEIRNPLANISALSQLLAKAKLDEKSQKHLKYILMNADLADKIIKDLLNFASPDELVFKYENINEILDNIIESVEPRCVKNNIKSKKIISENLPKVYVDKFKLENALMNFVSNALDAMQDRGGELKVTACKDNMLNALSISVSDTGCGISKENLDKILEPFFTTKQNGTGLGLGLAYQTIKSHRGSVKINSKPGEGTVVDIKIPLNNVQ